MKVDGQRLLDTFRRYLHDHGLPVTHQRLAVAEAIFFSGDHLSAEDIAGLVLKRGGPVGTATVYRTLEVLVESGLVTEHDFGEGFKRYEPGSGDGDPHEHCICSSCGAVTEFSNDRLERTTRDDEFNRVFCELRRRSGRRWRASFRKAQSTTKNVVGYATPR